MQPWPIMKLCRRLIRDTRGATALEYAIVLPVLFFLMMGLVEYDIVMGGSAVLDGAVVYAARLGKTGYTNATSTGTCPSPVVNGVVTPQTQSDFINCVVADRVRGFLDPSKLQIFAKDYGNFSSGDVPVSCTNTVSTPQTVPLCSTSDLGKSGEVVVYTVTYPWDIVTPFLQAFLGTGGVVTLSSSTVVKNEPY